MAPVSAATAAAVASRPMPAAEPTAMGATRILVTVAALTPPSTFTLRSTAAAASMAATETRMASASADGLTRSATAESSTATEITSGNRRNSYSRNSGVTEGQGSRLVAPLRLFGRRNCPIFGDGVLRLHQTGIGGRHHRCTAGVAKRALAHLVHDIADDNALVEVDDD